MTTTIQNLDDLQDRRIMMDRDVPPYGYAFVILVGLFMIFHVAVFGQYGHHFFCQFLHLVTGLGTHQIAENSTEQHQ